MTPPEKIVLASITAIADALSDHRLVPPHVAATSPTLTLRAAMARFSAAPEHGERRAAVDAAIASFDLATASAVADHFTIVRLQRARDQGARVEVITAIGRNVAVATVATLLGVQAAELDDVIDDVEAVVEVIGRGQASSARSDDAVRRLADKFASNPNGHVAAISTMYQSMDATAALVATKMVDQPAVVPVARTTRVASSPTTIDGTIVGTGTQVDLEIGAAGLWFGAGPHACPGRALAETIADAIVRAVETSDAVVDREATEVDADHRPIAVWLQLAR